MRPALVCAAVALLPACYTVQSSQGGGDAEFEAPRRVDPGDVALPRGYRIEPVVGGLTFPTKVLADARGGLYVVEGGYSYGEAFLPPRLLRLEPGGGVTTLAQGPEQAFWSGADLYEGAFYISEARAFGDSRILRVVPGSDPEVLLDGLPPIGIHHTNSPVVRDGHVYFPQGTMTNAGVPDLRDYKGGWLERHRDLHDVPAKDVVLAGVNYEVPNPFTPDDEDTVQTGAYVPFGTVTRAGQVVRGRLPATGAIMRFPLEGGPLELVAWGFRNPFRIAFTPDGRLLCSENGYDDSGARAVFASADFLWEVQQDTWYGWPDFAGGQPLTWERYKTPLQDEHRFVLAEHPNQPPQPIARLACHASVCGLDVSTSPGFGHVGQAFVAEFGDMTTATGKVLAPVGFKVVRVDLESGVIRDFLVNVGDTNGPASKLETGGLERPIDVLFGPDGDQLYVLDFGVVLIDQEQGTSFPVAGTGVLWRVTRTDASAELARGD